MEEYYKPLHKQVEDLNYKFHDSIDLDSNHPSVNLIRNELNHLKNDLETNKNPRSIETRMHTIQQQIMQAQHSGQGLMSADHTDHFNRTFESLRMNIRRTPHY
jgi:hypothetical protein